MVTATLSLTRPLQHGRPAACWTDLEDDVHALERLLVVVAGSQALAGDHATAATHERQTLQPLPLLRRLAQPPRLRLTLAHLHAGTDENVSTSLLIVYMHAMRTR